MSLLYNHPKFIFPVLLVIGLFLINNSQLVTAQSSAYKQAVKLFKKQEYKSAIPLLKKILDKTPNDEEVLYGLGVALYMNSVEVKYAFPKSENEINEMKQIVFSYKR